MAKLRLFANLREAAGTGRAELPGSTVGEILDAAVHAFGDEFAGGLSAANVWVNGSPANRATTVAETDEVALIPPVSGGARTLTEDATPGLLAIILLATFLVANVVSIQTLVFAAVGGALAWVWDVSDTMAERRVFVTAIPALVAATISGNAAYAWGAAGLAVGVALGIVVVLSWPLFDAAHRDLDLVSASAMTGIVAALGAGGLVLARIDSTVNVTAFLVIMVFGAMAAWVVRRFLPDVQGIDPNLAAAVGILVGAFVVGFISDTLSPAVSLVAGAAAVAGVFAGRAIGSLLRTGDVAHTTRGPGLLTTLDGVVLGAAAYWLGLLLFG
jgi:molybdopterin synthase sulfur carrier subunit